MGPDQARDEGRRSDGRSNVFSFGVTFYKLLAGKRPFREAGIYRDEPLFDRWRAAIDTYRQEIEDDSEIP